MELDNSRFYNHKVISALNAIGSTIRHVSKGADPVSPQQVAKILQFLLPKQNGKAMVLAIILQFMTLMRQSSIMPRNVSLFDPSRHLTVGDVKKTSDGLVIVHKWSKSEQSSHKEDIFLPSIPSSILCPVLAFDSIFSDKCNSSPSSPLIAFTNGGPMPLSYLIPYWNRAVELVKVEGQKLTMHSLRKGGAVFLQNFTGHDGIVKTYGRWKSQAVNAYIKDRSNLLAARAFKQNL